MEPAAFVFPLPDHLKDYYVKWARSLDLPSGDAPVFIPVYPAYPGFMPYPSFTPGNTSGACPCCGRATAATPGINPFILFLILILLLLGTRKDQILAAIRKLLLKTDQKPEQNPKKS